MRTGRLLLAALSVALPAAITGTPAQTASAAGADLTLAVSAPVIRITSNYTGGSVTAFGTLRLPAGESCRSDIVVTLRGPDESAVVRARASALALEGGEAPVRFVHVASFFKVAATAPLATIGTAETRAELGIDVDASLRRAEQGPTRAGAEQLRAAVAAWTHMKARDGLFAIAEDGVDRLDAVLFAATFAIPSAARVGPYEVDAFAFCGGALVAQRAALIQVYKTGFSQSLFEAAQRWPLLYGAAVTITALGCGLLANAAFGRLKPK